MMHAWWARRPLSACRAVLLSALVPDPGDEDCPIAFRRRAGEVLSRLRERRGGVKRNWHDPVALRGAMLSFIGDFSNPDVADDPDLLEASRQLATCAHEAVSGKRNTQPLVIDPFAGGGAIP